MGKGKIAHFTMFQFKGSQEKAAVVIQLGKNGQETILFNLHVGKQPVAWK